MKKIIILLTGIIVAGCASVAPKEVPLIKAEELPAIEMKTLKSKSVDLVVKNSRKINADAGNSKDIEDKIFSVLSESLAKSEISVSKSAVVRLFVEISDYNELKDRGECVQLEATIKLKRGTMTSKSYACYQFKNALFGFSMGGDISEAYQLGLSTLIKGINEQSEKYGAWF